MMEQIKCLRGPERVRCRPAVIFGNDNLDGAKNALATLLQVFLEAALVGRCRKIEVELHEDASITVVSHDGGLDLGSGDDTSGRAWRNLFCELYCDHAKDRQDGEYTYSLFSKNYLSEIYGEQLELPPFMPDTTFLSEFTAVQYVCSNMDVHVIRDGYERLLHFKKGYPEGDALIRPTTEAPLTKLYFTLDPEIFSDINVPPVFIQNTLGQYAFLVPGLVCTFTHKAEKSMSYYPDGIRSYVETNCPDAVTPVFYEELFASGKDRYNQPEYDAYVKIALCFTRNTSEQICIHNFRELTNGGTHYKKVADKICDAVNFQLVCELQDRSPLGWDEICKHLVLMVESGANKKSTSWKDGTRSAISQQLITDMAADVIGKGFDFVHEFGAELAEIMTKPLV